MSTTQQKAVALAAVITLLSTMPEGISPPMIALISLQIGLRIGIANKELAQDILEARSEVETSSIHDAVDSHLVEQTEGLTIQVVERLLEMYGA